MSLGATTVGKPGTGERTAQPNTKFMPIEKDQSESEPEHLEGK